VSIPPSCRQVSGLVAGTVPFSAVDGPGNRYVVFLQGCGFDCLVCHNPATIPMHPRGLAPTTVADVLAGIREAAPFLTGVTVTGGEATAQPHFLLELFTALAADPATAHLTRFVDSNGDTDPRVWQRLAPVTDGVMLDLKALDDEIHVVMTGSSNARVLTSLREVHHRGLLYEVRLLIVPGLNDTEPQLRATAAWLLALDPQLRVRLIGMRKQGTRVLARDLLEATPADLARCRATLADAGLPTCP